MSYEYSEPREHCTRSESAEGSSYRPQRERFDASEVSLKDEGGRAVWLIFKTARKHSRESRTVRKREEWKEEGALRF